MADPMPLTAAAAAATLELEEDCIGDAAAGEPADVDARREGEGEGKEGGAEGVSPPTEPTL